MVEIKNRKFQPLTLHLANSKRSVHLAPRGRAEIDAKDVSNEMRRAAERGFIALREVGPAAAPAKAATPAPARPATPAKTVPKKEPAPKAQAPDKNTEERR